MSLPRRPSRVLGVNIASSTAYFVVVDSNGAHLDEANRLAAGTNLVGAPRLHDFSARFSQEVSRLAVSAVAVIQPKRPAGWTYSDAFNRITLEATIILVCAERGVTYVPVRQVKAAATAAGTLITAEAVAASCGGRTSHWNARYLAGFAALAVFNGYSG